MSILKKLNRMTTEVLKNMTDAQLDAIVATTPHDMSKFTDAELDAIINGTASPELAQRVAIARKIDK